VSDPLRVGLIGCGRIAQFFHLRILAGAPGGRLVAVADAEPSLLASARKRADGATGFADYRDLLASAEVDAVVICLPTGMHAAAAIEALDAGKHVYLEKPVAINLDEGQRVLDAWRRSGKIGMTGFNFRFHPLHRRVKQMLQSGAIGRVGCVRSTFCASPRPMPQWKQRRADGGGVLLDLASHHIDLARFFFDREVETVHASVQSIRSEQDTATVKLQLTDGPVVQSTHSMIVDDVDGWEFYGEGKRLILDRYAGRVEVLQHDRPRKGPGAAVNAASQSLTAVKNALRPPGEPSFREALHAFIDATRTGKPIEPDLATGYRSLQVVDAAERSAESGTVIRLER
jgi:predicted dehydrogenase